MPARLSSLSIRATVLLAIVAGVIAPACVVLAIDRVLALESSTQAVQRARSAVLALGATTLSESAWTLNGSAIAAAAEKLLAEPAVCEVEVLDLQPASTALNVRRSRCDAATAVEVLELPVLHEGQKVARLRLGFDRAEAAHLLDDRLRTTAWLVAAQVLVGVFVIAAVLSWRLLRPLDRLKQQASMLSSREATPPQPWTRNDEVGQLGQHLDQVREHIQGLLGTLEKKNEELQRLALQDHLTGLPNRALLARLFDQHASAARRHGETMALLFIDLDHFKTVNDVLGHAAGDELIVETARRLEQTMRTSDIVCRMGGDEFVVLMPRVEGWDLVAGACERILRAVETPLQLHGAVATTQVSASVGVAMYPADAGDYDSLARMADLAMYRSKDLGRARYSFYQPDLDHALQQRLSLERELRRAIDHDELVLHYQPIFHGRDRRVIGCEALVRWQHPTRGLLMPGAFIEAAEQTGLIRDIGKVTLDMACAQFAEWREAGCVLDYVAVNVSVLQAHDPTLPETVKAAMTRHGLRPGQLELELTESALLSDTEGALRTVGRLRGVGAVLVIDDFGTGYSSLSYLKLLKPDKMKIDRSFVRDLSTDADDRALTQAIIGIAHTLSIDVVAEGVETEAQHELLLQMGCPLQQGYLHGRPVPAAQLAERLSLSPAELLA